LRSLENETKVKGSLQQIHVGVDRIHKDDMKNWTSVRMVYLLMSAVLLLGVAYEQWAVVIFVITMLQVGVWTKFCPSMWFFEKQGYKKTEL
jgi:hypothetical protein